MRKFFLIGIFCACFFLLSETVTHAMMDCWGRGERPYGGYRSSPERGWYGAAKAIKTKAEARKVLHEYYQGEAVILGDIVERTLYFEAEIKDRNKNVVDRVIINKKTGRIRSVY